MTPDKSLRFAAAVVLGSLVAVVMTVSPSQAQSNSWSSGAPMPTARFAPAFGVINGKVYVVSGATSSAIVNNTEVYNPTTNTWVTRAPIPTARFASAAAVVNGILYVIGGCDSGCAQGIGALSVVEAYNPSTNTWSTKAPLPTATDSIYAVAKNKIVYVIGGFVPGVGRVPTAYSYNPATDTWTQLASMKVGRSTPAVGVLGGIMAVGGVGNSGVVSDNERYSTLSNTWKTLAPVPTARTAGCFGAISGKFYFASGGAGSDSNTPVDVLEAYTALTKNWTTLASIPQAMVGPASAVVKGRLYCIGGATSGNLFQGVPFNDVQIYQP